MSKLSNFYQHKATLEQSGEFADLSSAQWDALEEKLIREDLMPRLMQQIAPVLSEVKSPLSVNINYSPDGAVAMTFTRNCIQSVFSLGEVVSSVMPTEEPAMPTEEVVFEQEPDNTLAEEKTELVEEEPDLEEEKTELVEEKETPLVQDDSEPCEPELSEEEPEKDEESQTDSQQRRKAVGFRVTFPDGTVICEPKAVETFVAALRKIGLERIYKANHGMEYCGCKLVDTKTYRYKQNEKKTKKQEKVGGYYIFINVNNEGKMRQILQLGKFFGIDIKVEKLGNETIAASNQETLVSEAQDEPVATSIQDQFLEYLESRISHDSAIGYIRHLNNGVRTFVHKLVDDKADSVFSFTTPDEVSLCIQLLEEDEEYNRTNDQQHHYFSAALKQWKMFVDRINEV